MPFEGRWWAVRECMSKMAATAGANDLGAQHAVTGVAYCGHMCWIIWCEKARPAGAGIELGTGAKQRQTAQTAGVDPLLLVIEEGAAVGCFGAMTQQYLLFFGSERADQGLALAGTGRAQVELGHGVLICA